MSHQTRIDLFRPGHASSLIMPVAAGARETRWALQQLDLMTPAVRALRAVGLGERVALRPGGLAWRPPNTGGRVDVAVDVRVRSASDDGSLLTITTRFSATDDRAHARLSDAWAVVGPLADHLTRRAARTVKDYAEADRFGGRDALERAHAA